MAEQMLAWTRHGEERSGVPTLVLLHFLGGSQHAWDDVLPLLAQQAITVDLPGFGASADVPGYSVTEMTDALERTVQSLALDSYILVGHSMGGKVAAVLARRMQDRQDGRLVGLVLVAPSPPGPEPMPEEKRQSMLGWFGQDAAGDLSRARRYISRNGERQFAPDVEDRAAHEVLRMNRAAWSAWLTGGSTEDWAERVDVLMLPALVIAGEKDASLGPARQQEVTLPHLGNGRMEIVKGCSHLVPMEKPAELAALLKGFVAGVSVPPNYLRFLESDRLSEPTRKVVVDRLAGPAPHAEVLNATQQRTLRAMLARIVPGTELDLAGVVLARLASGKGDGWRYDVLPADAQAYCEGLDRLAAKGFADLAPEAQDALLTGLATEQESAAARWFEEVRGDAVSAYMAHPQTLARVGYSGFGVGGAHTPHKGYVQLGPDAREAWEPVREEQ